MKTTWLTALLITSASLAPTTATAQTCEVAVAFVDQNGQALMQRVSSAVWNGNQNLHISQNHAYTLHIPCPAQIQITWATSAMDLPLTKWAHVRSRVGNRIVINTQTKTGEKK